MATEPPAVAAGLDIGRVRTGIARADPSGTLASAISTVDTEPLSSLHQRIVGALGPVRIGQLIAGLPLDQHGGESKATRFVREVCARISAELDLQIEFQDERFSTAEMQTRLREGGMKHKDVRDRIDAWSAATILQSWLDSRH